MKPRRSVALLVFAVAALMFPRVTVFAVTPHDMRIWMLPPMDTLGENACLTQGYHDDGTDEDNVALDWKANCGETVSRPVRFRAVVAAVDDLGYSFIGAHGEPTDLPNALCTSNPLTTVHYFRVKVRATWDGQVKGRMSYAHTHILDTAPASFDLWFNAGPFETGAINSVNVAETVSDAAAPKCWTGFHVHENNAADSEWNGWHHSIYDEPVPHTDTYDNDDRNNWTRSQTWTENR